ncbi:MAG TPA: response regulator [Blastocatellia bacterium]|nr:response regulator [Blastocatellia bacterium]
MQAQPAQELQQVDVLLVDDDRTGLMILSRSLERANFSVVTANSANEALETLQTHRPEVILADVSMPGMDGFEFFRTVRANGLVDVPFIFCSGRDGALDRILGLRMGADDYLVKPIVPEEVILKVRLQITKVQYLRALKAALESKDSHSVMSGNFGGISVLDVLQTARMLGQGEYAVHFTTDEDTATVYLNNGQVLHTETGWFTGTKAFSRLLEWEKGRFNIEHKHLEDEPTMANGLEELMLDLLTQLDEVRVLRQQIAAKGKHFVVEVDGEYLSENEIILCDLIETSDSVDTVFDSPLLSDKEIAETWLQLLQKGTIKAKP